jgi:general secretion pathway protein C
VWFAVGLCAAYWAFKFVTSRPVQAAAVAPAAVVVDSAAIAKFLGASDKPVAAKPAASTSSTKFTLTGIAATQRGTGYALIAMDGKPARPYRLGAKVGDEYVLKTLTPATAVLAATMSEPDALTLELPTRKPATAVAATAAATSVGMPSMVPPAVKTLGSSTDRAAVLQLPPQVALQIPSDAAAAQAVQPLQPATQASGMPGGMTSSMAAAAQEAATAAAAGRAPVSRFAPKDQLKN